MSEQRSDHEANETETPKRRGRGFRRGAFRDRSRARGTLAGSPPGAGGRLIDLRGPRLY